MILEDRVGHAEMCDIAPSMIPFNHRRRANRLRNRVIVGENEHLLHYFTDPTDGTPIQRYLDAVRRRFGQWILDTAAAKYDQQWLDYQFEIGRRHHRSWKNRTDGVSAVDHIPYRYVAALAIPITTTLKPFLGNKGHGTEQVDRMHAGWVKSVTENGVPGVQRT